MTEPLPFRCCICNSTIGNPHLSLDRRIERLSVIDQANQPVNSIDIIQRETLLMYCSHDCWQQHQTDVAKALGLKKTYPAFAFVTPCCHCGQPVNRTRHYVCYSISEMKIEGADVLIDHVIDEHDFAVLCQDCEHPDLYDESAHANEPEEASA